MDNGLHIKIIITNLGYMISKINSKNKFHMNWWSSNIDESAVKDYLIFVLMYYTPKCWYFSAHFRDV